LPSLFYFVLEYVIRNAQDQIKGNEVGGACITYWRDEKCIENFCQKTLREETTRKNLA